jgi:hypothetical protein
MTGLSVLVEDTLAGQPALATAIEAGQVLGFAKVEERWEVFTEGSTTTYANRETTTTYANEDERGLRGADLEAFDSRSDFGCWVVERAGLRMDAGGQLEQVWRVGAVELVVSVWLDRGYQYVVLVRAGWPEHPAPKSLTLAEVFAITETRQVRQLRGPEMARWKLRALAEAGLVTPPPVSPPPIPADAPPHAHTFRHVLERLLAIRRLTEAAGTPLPLSVPFLANWSGRPADELQRGKYWYAKRRLIEKAGTVHVGKPKPLQLWRITGEENAA